MKKSLIVVWLCCIGVLRGATPNVLYIVVDDLKADIASFGESAVRTPNIDRLVARGVKFDHAYCQFPLCNPSRTSFLSGMRPETSGVIQQEAQLRKVKPDTVFMPGWFKQHGFMAASTGKVFHKDDEQSWTVSESGKPTDPQEKAAVDSRSKRRQDGEAGAEWTQLDCDDAHTGDGVLARRAVDFIEQALSEKKRFFVAAGFRKPHLPWTAPKNYFAMYPPKEVTLDTEPEMKNVPDIARITDISGAPAPSSRAEAVAAYRACISFMDAQVGVLLAEMDQKKLWDDTIVVFHSDHGYHLGDHGGLWAKLTDFEQCARVPLVVAVPGGKKGGTCSRLVELIDLYPTLCELTGLARPVGIEGPSLVPLTDDPKAAWDHPAFTVTVHEE